MSEIIYRKVEKALPNSTLPLKYTSALIDATDAARELLDGVEKAYLEVARYYEGDKTPIEKWKQAVEEKTRRNEDVIHCFDNGEIDIPDEYLYVRFASGKETFFTVSEHGYLGGNKTKGIFW